MVNTENTLATAVEIAREAGSLLNGLLDSPHEISYKGPMNLVTEADKRSEELIISRLRGQFPGYRIVAEEGSGQESSSDYCWYVDPLDGTTNFAHGFPVFCVSLGLAFRDDVVAGVVFDPTRQEVYTAERGAGAFVNGKRLEVSKIERLSESLLATGFPPFGGRYEQNFQYYIRFTGTSHGVRRAGSAALDLCWVAAGRFDGFWELKLHPWDKAAGVLMVTEAGGRVTDIAGGRFNLLGNEVFASNGLIHDAMLRVFSQTASS